MSVRTQVLTPADPWTADAADGPKIVAWLERQGHLEDLTPRYGEAMARRMWAWRRGAKPDFFAVDEVLNTFDVLPSDLPDEVWFHRRWEVR